jgi:AcrR family transcriptional regulator
VRTGRRPGGLNTREAILDAARTVFHSEGYDAATIRGVASHAGVDPALVHHYFGTKRGLFVTAMRLPVDPAQIVQLLLEGDASTLGLRIARMFFAIWEGTDTNPFVALIRSATSHDDAARMLRELVTQEIIGPVAAHIGRPDAELRATLVGTQMVGIVMMRYILRLEPIASADPEHLVEAVAPTIQRYLAGDLRTP